MLFNELVGCSVYEEEVEVEAQHPSHEHPER